MANNLFQSLQIGDYTIKNRIIMAPMTRGRCGEEGIPDGLVADYYSQRSSAGLIISEATAVNKRGHGWPGAPGIYTDQQQAGWKNVADAVHQQNGRIFMQIWHMGRAVLSESIDGLKPLSPSPIAATGEIPNKHGVPTGFVTPEPMCKNQIDAVVKDFATAAKRAIDAGIDGVEIHAANNFLIDAFLRDSSNQRDDNYGGTIENRCRFLFEIVDAVTDVIGAGKIGVRLSPTNAIFGISDSNPEAIFTAAVKGLAQRHLAYLHILEPANGSDTYLSTDIPTISHILRDTYAGVFILNGSMNQQTGNAALQSGAADAVAYGTAYIANPDLVERFRDGLELAKPDPDTFYTPGAEGYTTYPTAIKKDAT